MKNYAIETEMLTNPRRMLISNFKLLCSNFIMELGLQCTKNYSPRKCFNNFVQSVVDARREEDENPLSGVVAETMKHWVILRMFIRSWIDER